MPEIARLIHEYEVGELADPNDILYIISGISQLLSDPDRYAELRENARRAAAIFNWVVEKEKLMSLYEGLG